ncbi:hypothetical protein CC86DRAFT_139695 [Ophiobolus disseminans]|uniref:Uncharacterized protein n=1 Tax=Ophiobolus disseminans TaxID=1469910 RepID=A0A6A7ADZ7_9PLEO|nr:hypothetical protein CC86DRAFT_139695 [Ophiobolus disseminans]
MMFLEIGWVSSMPDASSSIAGLRKELEAKFEELCKANAALATANMPANSKIEQIEKLERGIETRDGALRTMEAFKDNLLQQNSCLDQLVKAKTKHIAMLEPAAKKNAALKNANTSLLALNAALKDESTKSKKFTSALEQANTRLCKAMRDREKALREKQTLLASKDLELRNLTQHVNMKRTCAKYLIRQNELKASDLAALSMQIAYQASHIQHLESLLENSDAQVSAWRTNTAGTIRALNSQINERGERISQLVQQTTVLGDRADVLQGQLRDVAKKYAQQELCKVELEAENERLGEALRGLVEVMEGKEEEEEMEGEDEMDLSSYDDMQVIEGVDPEEYEGEMQEGVVLGPVDWTAF